jgi:hypothetical protein
VVTSGLNFGEMEHERHRLPLPIAEINNEKTKTNKNEKKDSRNIGESYLLQIFDIFLLSFLENHFAD